MGGPTGLMSILHETRDRNIARNTSPPVSQIIPATDTPTTALTNSIIQPTLTATRSSVNELQREAVQLAPQTPHSNSVLQQCPSQAYANVLDFKHGVLSFYETGQSLVSQCDLYSRNYMGESVLGSRLLVPQYHFSEESNQLTLLEPLVLSDMISQLTAFPVPLTSLVFGLVGFSDLDLVLLKAQNSTLELPIPDTLKTPLKKLTRALLLLEFILAQHYSGSDTAPSETSMI